MAGIRVEKLVHKSNVHRQKMRTFHNVRSRISSRLVRSALAATFLLGFAAGAHAQFTGQLARVPGGQAIDDLDLARQLAEHGRRTKSPLSLLAAADLRIGNPTRPLDPELLDPKEHAPPRTTARAAVAELLDEARALSRGNRTLRHLVEQMERRADRMPVGQFRGARGAPRELRETAAGKTRVVFVATFMGGEPALVRLAGSGGTDLNLYIYDEYGDLIASDSNPTDLATTVWRPERTAKFRIEIRNLGAVPNAYWLVTN